MKFSRLPDARWTDDLPVEVFSQTEKTIELGVEKESIIPHIIKNAVSRGGEIISCQIHEESLTDLFERLTNQG